MRGLAKHELLASIECGNTFLIPSTCTALYAAGEGHNPARPSAPWKARCIRRSMIRVIRSLRSCSKQTSGARGTHAALALHVPVHPALGVCTKVSRGWKSSFFAMHASSQACALARRNGTLSSASAKKGAFTDHCLLLIMLSRMHDTWWKCAVMHCLHPK